MPLELQIIRACEFVRLKTGKHLDLATSYQILQRLADACRLRGINQALLDMREIQPGLTPMLSQDDLGVLVSAFDEIGFSPKQRVSILYGSDRHFRVRLFAYMSTVRGWNVKAHENFEEALLWLSEGKEDKPKRKIDSGHEIPMQFTTDQKTGGEQNTK